MNTTSPEQEYERIWAGYTDKDVLPPELAKIFSKRFNWEFVKLALPLSKQHYGLRVQQAVRNMLATVKEHDMFDVSLEGKKALADRDLILGNHQGPNGEDGTGQGGLETVFGCELLPHKSRFVMKHEILQFGLRPKSIVTALSQRKGKPIPFHRQEQGDMDHREYAKILIAERQRVFTEIFRVINDEHCPVMIYPEGTRSPSGKILPLMKGLFETALTDYVIPCMRNGQEPKIGLKIADTLQVFRHGRGGGVPLYRKKVTIRGLPYDASALMEEIDACDEPFDSPNLPVRKLSMFFAKNVHACMQRELCEILQQS